MAMRGMEHIPGMNMKATGSGIWLAKGSGAGPHVVILGGVHGDEKTGIDVVQRLHALFTAGDERLAAGTLTLVLGNEEAIGLNQRGTTVEHNLNRMFTKNHLAGPVLDFYESRRAHELATLLASADISIDIHSTSSPSRPFLPCAFSPRHERIYRWFSCDLVLTDPDYILGGERATTDEYVDSCGGVGICFETGFAGDTSRAPAVLESIQNVLADAGLSIPGRTLPPPEPSYRVYRMVRRILLNAEGFSYAGKFPDSFQPVQKGEIIGYHGTRPEIAEEEGVIVFPKAPEQWHTGHDIFFLARRIQ
jgi:succinylglutamate desuccinylase